MNTAIIPQSDSDWQIFKFGEIEVLAKLDEKDEPIILAAPICQALGLDDVSKAVSRLDEDEKDVKISTPNGVPVRHLVVTEAGLYSLILGSRKPEAKALKRFVTHEVLPAIRKTGSFSIAKTQPSNLDFLEGVLTQLRQQDRFNREVQQELTNHAQELETVKSELHNVKWQRITVYCNKQGIKYKSGDVSRWTHECKELSNQLGYEIRHKEVQGKRWDTENAYHIDILSQICGKFPPKKSKQMSFLDDDEDDNK